jgi:hypothetical protein
MPRTPPKLALPVLGHKGRIDHMATANEEGTTTTHLVLAWAFVGIPLVLGVLQTLVNAMKLFQ